MTTPQLTVSLIRAASHHTGLHMSRIHSSCREEPLCEARWACWHVMREQGKTLREIGAAFRVNYTTVIHGLKRAAELDGRRGKSFRALCEAVKNHQQSPTNKK